MKHHILTLLCISIFFSSNAEILHVGFGQPIPTLEVAAQMVNPGDTIRVHEGPYIGGLYIENLQGQADAWILIEAAPGETVVYEGGNNAWQFTDAAYLIIRGFIFQGQTGNGLNFDDGGSYVTPTHHIYFVDCTFRDMNASGNNDLLKLSGLDDFEIRNCTFLNGAAGGSGIDMVGCHRGLITQCHFENLGSNSVQAKGGTSQIRIEANFFKNGGQRSLNLGGSTGLQFFRPIDAPYEAAELYVYSNVFIGSVAPIAFVGSINCEVINNTMYLPERWALRILQETVDTTRFPPCGNNTFRNNILFVDDQLSTACNIGPNTDAASFTFSNNLWYHADNQNWNGPELPVTDTDNIVNEDPLFEDVPNENFALLMGSPAIGQGYNAANPHYDFYGNEFNVPRSIGAIEGDLISGLKRNADLKVSHALLYPNPSNEIVHILINDGSPGIVYISLYDTNGKQIKNEMKFCMGNSEPIGVDIKEMSAGLYFVQIEKDANKSIHTLIIQY